jgi:hypothetical protein
MKRSTWVCLVCVASALSTGCLFEYSEFDFEEDAEQEGRDDEPSTPEESDAGTNESRTPPVDVSSE